MNIINALATYFQQHANSYARENSLNIRFKARTYASFLDNIIEEDTIEHEDMETIPIYIDNPIGNYDAVPGISKSNQSFEINFFFPIDYKEIMLEMLDYWPTLLVAKRISLVSGDNPICNISKPVFGEVQPATMERFSQFIRDNFGDVVIVKRTDYWLNYKFTIFMSSAVSTNGNTMFWGNDISFKLKADFKIKVQGVLNAKQKDNESGNIHVIVWRGEYWTLRNPIGPHWYAEHGQYVLVGDVLYTDEELTQPAAVIESIDEYIDPAEYEYRSQIYEQDLIYTSANTSQNNSPIGQQLIDEDNFVKNVINTTNYSKSIMVYVENTGFWNAFIDAYNNQNENLIDALELTKTYKLSISEQGKDFKQYKQHIISINENISLGELLSFTITFSDAFEQGE